MLYFNNWSQSSSNSSAAAAVAVSKKLGAGLLN